MRKNHLVFLLILLLYNNKSVSAQILSGQLITNNYVCSNQRFNPSPDKFPHPLDSIVNSFIPYKNVVVLKTNYNLNTNQQWTTLFENIYYYDNQSHITVSSATINNSLYDSTVYIWSGNRLMSEHRLAKFPQNTEEYKANYTYTNNRLKTRSIFSASLFPGFPLYYSVTLFKADTFYYYPGNFTAAIKSESRVYSRFADTINDNTIYHYNANKAVERIDSEKQRESFIYDSEGRLINLQITTKPISENWLSNHYTFNYEESGRLSSYQSYRLNNQTNDTFYFESIWGLSYTPTSSGWRIESHSILSRRKIDSVFVNFNDLVNYQYDSITGYLKQVTYSQPDDNGEYKNYYKIELRYLQNPLLLNKTPEALNCRIYPNPANDILVVENTQDILKVEWFNSSGAIVSVPTKEKTTSYTSFDTSALPDGLYLLKGSPLSLMKVLVKH
ncbi:MAG: T9SS type A sorting domain-containing protein [Bacteroidia bacterium]